MLYYVETINISATSLVLGVEAWSGQVRAGFDEANRLTISDF